MFDILLKRDNLDDLPETVAITDLYKETDDGTFELAMPIRGVKPEADFERINEALRKERNDHKAIKTRYASLADKDVNEVLAQLDEIDEMRAKLEASGDVSEEKIEALVEKRLARIKAPLERDLAKLTTERDEALEAQKKLSSDLDDLVISQTLTELAIKNCNQAVQKDVVEIGRLHLTRDPETGEVVTKDESPLPAAEWLKAQLDERSHWNKDTGGGNNGRGNTGGGKKTKNPFTPDNYDFNSRRWLPGALAAQDAYLAEHGRDAWRSAATTAGVNPERPGSPPRRPDNSGRAAA